HRRPFPAVRGPPAPVGIVRSAVTATRSVRSLRSSGRCRHGHLETPPLPLLPRLEPPSASWAARLRGAGTGCVFPPQIEAPDIDPAHLPDRVTEHLDQIGAVAGLLDGDAMGLDAAVQDEPVA